MSSFKMKKVAKTNYMLSSEIFTDKDQFICTKILQIEKKRANAPTENEGRKDEQMTYRRIISEQST